MPVHQVRRDAGADGGVAPGLDLRGVEQSVDRLEAATGDGITEMRVVEHEQVVALRELLDRRRLEAFERLHLPAQRVAATHGHGRGLEGGPTARVVPGEAAEIGHGETGTPESAIAPESISACARSSSIPSSASISRVCSPTSGAPRSTRGGVFENRYGKPGVFTWPSVGWS